MITSDCILSAWCFGEMKVKAAERISAYGSHLLLQGADCVVTRDKGYHVN